jgi:aerobic carbon-monoxide dehydrogenase medium subunit
VIPAPFEYERAESVEQAISLLRQHGEDAKLIAGGHSLLPLMKLRLARPSVLVDIDRLSDLEFIGPTRAGVAIGSLTRLHDLTRNETLRNVCPILAGAAEQVGDPQVRHRATIGGSAAHGDPAGDLPAVLLALDATFEARGPDGERSIPASEFFTSLFETALRPDEVLTEIRVNTVAGPGRGRGRYLKFHRRAIDWAIVGVAALVERDDGQVRQASVALTNMALTPIRARAVEDALTGSDGSPEAIRAAADLAPEGTSPPEDTNGSAEYRRELSKVLVRRALEEAMAGAARTM